VHHRPQWSCGCCSYRWLSGAFIEPANGHKCYWQLRFGADLSSIPLSLYVHRWFTIHRRCMSMCDCHAMFGNT
jgi:hypothetical protein